MTKFITFVSGKGGVGKTTSTIGVGQAFLKLGKKVLLVDANIVTPNLAINLGLMNPKATLNQFLRKENSIEEITYLHESGLSFIPASPSFVEFQKTNPGKLGELFEHLDNTIDYVLIDAPSGLGYEVKEVLKNSDEVVLVVNPNLSSVMDALKTMELAKAHDNVVTGIILNMTNKGRHELKAEEIENILGCPILGNIRLEKKIRKAAYRQAPVNYLFPYSRPARELLKIADYLNNDSRLRIKE